MKILVFERPFQQDQPESCKPTNNFSRGPKVLSLKKKWQPPKIFDDYLKPVLCEFETFYLEFARLSSIGKHCEFETKCLEFACYALREISSADKC